MKPNEDFLDTLITQINGLLLTGKQTGEDIRHNLRAVIQAQIAKLDVVSREEFDAQQAILEKTRTQIEQLQKQIDELEKSLNTSSQ